MFFFHYKPTILGFPHLWKPTYTKMIFGALTILGSSGLYDAEVSHSVSVVKPPQPPKIIYPLVNVYIAMGNHHF